MSDNVEELKDIIVQSLEEQGIISKLRAQIRKHVFDAIHIPISKPSFVSPSFPVPSPLVFSLVLDLLTHHGLDYTRSVLEAEGQLEGQHSTPYSREDMWETLGLTGRIEGNNGSVLQCLVDEVVGKQRKEGKENESRSGINKQEGNLKNHGEDRDLENMDVIANLENSYTLRKTIEEERLAALEKRTYEFLCLKCCIEVKNQQN